MRIQELCRKGVRFKTKIPHIKTQLTKKLFWYRYCYLKKDFINDKYFFLFLKIVLQIFLKIEIQYNWIHNTEYIYHSVSS